MTPEAIGALSGLFAVLGGILRYVLRISMSIERAQEIAQATMTALDRHTTASDKLHERLTDQVGQHTTRLAVLETRHGRP